MSINGMTRAARALQYWERRQEIVANNLANADTAGFKGERVFARLMAGELSVADTATDLRPGALKQTDGPLDLALGGDGFFVMETADGERLTRGGSFRLNEEGQIVDASGNRLLGEGGPLNLPPGRVEIDGAGGVRVDGRDVGRLRVERVPAGTELQHAGGNLYLPAPDREAVEPGERVVRQGYLEDSNVSPVDAMVDMISIQRAYSAVQRTVTTLDGIRETISTQLGKPV